MRPTSASPLPDVSVVVPTHARKVFLVRLLESLAAQSIDRDRFEVLIVHNYTNDGTEEAVAEWIAGTRLNVRYFRRNFTGPTRSRDLGAREARGPYVAFIDDDCVASERWLQSALDLLERAESSGELPRGQTHSIGLVQGRTLPMPGQTRRLLEKTIEIISPTVFFETCNIFYSRAAFEFVGGFSREFLDEFYGEDTDLGWKVRRAGFETAFCPDALAYHEVFAVSVLQWLREPLHFKNIPYLVRKFPELREHMTARWFLMKDTMYFYPFAVGIAVIAWIPLLGVLLIAPYVVYRYRESPRIRNPVLRIVRAFAGIPRTLMMCAALVRGSVRARSFLL